MMATLRRFMVRTRPCGDEKPSAGHKGPLSPQYSEQSDRRNVDRPFRPLHPAAGKATMAPRTEVFALRSTVQARNERRVLCVFPHYTPAFGTFNHAYRLMKGVRAFMPPQGLLLIAAYMPQCWQVRFVDENICRARAADFKWADIVAVSGMHVQAGQIHNIAARAHAAGKVVVLGGPSVSAAPEMYPEVDYLHIGEIGDGTDRLI